MFEGKIRTTLEIKYKDEVRDLNITFGLIDRVRRSVPWERLAMEIADPERPSPDFAMMAKFLYLNLKEAGFKDVDIDELYDSMMFSEDNQSGYIMLVSQILLAYQPQGPKKKSVAKEGKKGKK